MSETEENTVPILEEKIRLPTKIQEIKHPVLAHVLEKSEANDQPDWLNCTALHKSWPMIYANHYTTYCKVMCRSRVKSASHYSIPEESFLHSK